MGIMAIAMLIIGIYFAVTESNWILLIIAIFVTVCAVIFAIRIERRFRDEP